MNMDVQEFSSRVMDKAVDLGFSRTAHVKREGNTLSFNVVSDKTNLIVGGVDVALPIGEDFISTTASSLANTKWAD